MFNICLWPKVPPDDPVSYGKVNQLKENLYYSLQVSNKLFMILTILFILLQVPAEEFINDNLTF